MSETADILINAETGEAYRKSVIYGFDDGMLEEAIENAGYEIPEGEEWNSLRERVAELIFEEHAQLIMDSVAGKVEEILGGEKPEINWFGEE